MMWHVNRKFSLIDVFTDDFRDDYFYLSEAIEEIARVDSICTQESGTNYFFFPIGGIHSVAQRSPQNKVIHDIKTM